MKSILDRSFRYTKSIDTDIRKTFARVRREQRAAELPGNRTIIALMPKDKQPRSK